MTTADRDNCCSCSAPNWVSHAGWFICSKCSKALPFMTPREAIAYMRKALDEGGRNVARRAREQ